MTFLRDILFAVAILLTAPVWLVRMTRTGKIRTDWPARFGRGEVIPRPTPTRPRLLIHAVSVGEVNAIRLLVEQLRSTASQPEIVISTTTDTGFARARSLFEPGCQVVRYPLDVSFSVKRFLDRVLPDAIILTELEVWPTFAAVTRRRGIPLAVINGRLTERSAKRYRLIKPFIQRAFRGLAFAAVQNGDYADRFRMMGVPADRVHITGTMKWDTAMIADEVPGSDALAEAMGIDRSRPLIVAGSTAPDEHALIRDAVPEGVQILCAPRKPEWFDQAERDLPGCARRSRLPEGGGSRGEDRGGANDRFLLDTIGELRAAYMLADVVIVGRSFGDLHGSDMMEPIALGKPTIVGPAVTDFADIVAALRAGDGILQVAPRVADLRDAIAGLLNDPHRAAQLAANGRAVIRENQGATARHTALVLELLHP